MNNQKNNQQSKWVCWKRRGVMQKGSNKEEKESEGERVTIWRAFESQWHFVLGHSSWAWSGTPSRYQHMLGSTSFLRRRNMGICVIEESQLCVHTHTHMHMLTRTPVCSHTFSWSSWGVNFTPRLCECWPQNAVTSWSVEFSKPEAVMCCFL